MRDGNPAARSAAMFAGFLALVWLQVGVALLLVFVVLALLPGPVAVRVGVPLTIATGGLLWYATVRALRLRYRPPVGVPVTRKDAPELWSLVGAASAAAGVAPPDAVTVVADAAATLTERLRFGGLAGGRRDLQIGLPLLLTWDVPRLRAAVAHELAHGSRGPVGGLPDGSRGPSANPSANPSAGPADAVAGDSRGFGWFAPLAYRGRIAVARIVRRIPRRSPAGPLLRAYARWYLAADLPFAHAQEFAADRIAASFAGAPAAASVLLDAPMLSGMQQMFHAEYLSAGWQAGHVPQDIFGGYLRVLAARADEASALRSHRPEAPSAGDSHPPVVDRLSALLSAADPIETGAPTAGSAAAESSAGGSSVPGSAVESFAAESGADGSTASGGPAGPPAANPSTSTSTSTSASPSPSLSTASAAASSVAAGSSSASSSLTGDDVFAGYSADPEDAAGDLVPDLPGLARALQAVAFPAEGRRAVGWDEFFGVARFAEMEREADAALRSVARAAGTPVTGPADVLDLSADGRLRKVAEDVFGDLPPEATTDRIVDLITLLVALAALRCGAARWRHSWTGSAELVAIDGGHLDLAGPATLAADPATVGEARDWLAGLGIDLVAEVGESTAAARVPVLGGMVNLLVDGARTDVLVVETGLVLLPSLPRSRHAESRRRLSRLAADGVGTDGSLPTEGLLPTGGSLPTGGASPLVRPSPERASSGAVSSDAAVAGSSAEDDVLPVGADVAAAGRAAAGDSSPGGPSSGGSSPGDSSPGRSSPGITSLGTGSSGLGTRSSGAGPDGASSGARPGDVVTGSRFIPFVDVATAAAIRAGRRGWEIALRDGGTITVRSALDSDELPGGWAALEDAVDFLARTR